MKVVNEKQIEKWTKGDEVYAKCLRSGEALRNHPKINGTPACHRFHLRGYCFQNCNNKDSHTDGADILKSDQKITKNG